MAKQLNKIEERRAKKLNREKEEAGEEDGDDDGFDKVKKKKMKNLKKQMDYHQRKRREFKQREPITDQIQVASADKRQRLE